MDPLTVQIALYGTAAATAIAFGFLEPRVRARLRFRRTIQWRSIASSLDLDWHAQDRRLSGWMNDHFVAGWFDGHWTRVAASLWPPLDLGLGPPLEMSLEAWMARRRGEPARMATESWDAARTRELLEGRVTEQLLSSPWEVVLTDQHVVLCAANVATETQLRGMLELAEELASRIDERREEVSVPTLSPALTEGWPELALAQGLRMTRTPVGMVGTVRGLGARAFLRRRERSRWYPSVMAEFREPLEIGFRARPRAEPGEDPWSMQAVSTGDRAFDEVFSVTAFETEYVKQALSEGARTRALDLARQWRRVVIDDYGVLVEAERADRQTLERMLDDAVSTAELVDFVHPKRTAAYR